MLRYRTNSNKSLAVICTLMDAMKNATLPDKQFGKLLLVKILMHSSNF